MEDKNIQRTIEEVEDKKVSRPTLFVGRLDYNFDSYQLEALFAAYCPAKCTVVYDTNGQSRGYAFVEFLSEDQQRRAYLEMDGRQVGNRKIVVDIVRGQQVYLEGLRYILQTGFTNAYCLRTWPNQS
jgi:RNA recognition motif-containing protein